MASRLAAAAARRRSSVSPLLPTATTSPALSATTPLSSSLGSSAATPTPTPTPLSFAASSHAILGRRALSLPILARSGMVTTKPLLPNISPFSVGVFSLSPRALSTAILGRRAPSLPHAASVLCTPSGSVLARRGMATGMTPEVQEALNKIEKGYATRHEKLMGELRETQEEILRKYAASKVASGNTGLTAGKVALRVSVAVLAFGVGATIAILLTIQDGWKVDFIRDVRPILQKTVDKLKEDLLSDLRQVVRDEMIAIEEKKKKAKK